MNILDWFDGRYPLSQLERLAQGLPPESRYKAALLRDEQIALRIVQMADPDKPRRQSPDLVGWNYQCEMLTAIYDALQHLSAIIVAVNSKNGKAPKVTPLPRPETAIEAARTRRKEAELAHLFEAFRPKN